MTCYRAVVRIRETTQLILRVMKKLMRFSPLLLPSNNYLQGFTEGQTHTEFVLEVGLYFLLVKFITDFLFLNLSSHNSNKM